MSERMNVKKGRAARREALFGGRNAVLVWDLLGSQAAPPFGAVLACELEPDGSVGRHEQQEHAEIVIGLEGDGEARVNDRAAPLRSGDVVYVAHGAVLAIENRSASEPLRYLIVKALPSSSQ